ncbi:hypothetical protein [Actinomadura sp. 9N407]|uniref:hypothetical protein n=1 Tax=Actinomadura sp. 9N407 TaxID=3375154 RepID=UPI0037AB05E7
MTGDLERHEERDAEHDGERDEVRGAEHEQEQERGADLIPVEGGPLEGEPVEGGDSAEIGALIGRLSGDEGLDGESRGRLLGRLTRLLGRHARQAGASGVARGRWLTELLVAAAPHIPIRDARTLSEHHHGLTGEELADSVVRVAGNATTAVGAAGGALAAAEFAAPPLLLTAPAQLAAETLVVAAIEVKMIAELHEVYGVRVDGSGTARGAAFLTSWARQRGLNPLEAGSFTSALGSAAKSALRKRLLRTFGRSMSTLGPFLTGAAAGAVLNRTATKSLAAAVRRDLSPNLASPGALPGPLPVIGPGERKGRQGKGRAGRGGKS